LSDAAYVTVTAEGKVEYRASALGGCDLALLAARLGYDAIPIREDAKILKVFEAGHRIEDEVLNEYFPTTVVQRQETVRLPITRNIDVVGHIDGFDTTDGCIVEVKSQSQDAWDLFEKKHWDAGLFLKYKWQVSAYMWAHFGPFSHHPLKLIRALRDENQEWTGEYTASYVDYPFYSIAQIRERILRIELAAQTGVLIAECTPSFPCPYFYLHEEIDRDMIDDESVCALAREYVEAKQTEAIAKGKKANVKKALRIAVEKDKYKTKDGYKITFYTASDPPRLDKELLEGFLKVHNRELNEFMKQGRSERLRITPPEEGEHGSSSTDTET
jgi:hypothetical protein